MAKSKVEYWLTSDGLTLLEGWARDGLTDEQIMHNMGIQSKSTFYGYKKRYPNISNALKKGKEVADYEVENALFKRALGYTYEEKTYEKVYDKETGLYVERLTKHQIQLLKYIGLIIENQNNGEINVTTHNKTQKMRE